MAVPGSQLSRPLPSLVEPDRAVEFFDVDFTISVAVCGEVNPRGSENTASEFWKVPSLFQEKSDLERNSTIRVIRDASPSIGSWSHELRIASLDAYCIPIYLLRTLQINAKQVPASTIVRWY